MNHLRALPFASSLTLTLLALYLTCAVAVALFPGGTIAFFNTWFHGLDLGLLRPPGGRALTLAQFVLGALAVFVVAFPGGLVFSAIYNLLSATAGRTSRTGAKHG